MQNTCRLERTLGKRDTAPIKRSVWAAVCSTRRPTHAIRFEHPRPRLAYRAPAHSLPAIFSQP